MKKVAYTSPQFVIILLSGQRSNSGHHRCVTLLYRIPTGINNCIIENSIKLSIFYLKNIKLFQIENNSNTPVFIVFNQNKQLIQFV